MGSSGEKNGATVQHPPEIPAFSPHSLWRHCFLAVCVSELHRSCLQCADLFSDLVARSGGAGNLGPDRHFCGSVLPFVS